MKKQRLKYQKNALLRIGFFLTVMLAFNKVSGQNWGGGSTGTNHDLYIINQDKSNYNSMLRLQSGSEKGWNISNDQGRLKWEYSTGSVTSRGTTRMTLLSNGNFGIGNVSPAEKLDVNGNTLIRGTLNFGSSKRQMINLWNDDYAIGIQSLTQYFRSDKNFAWYAGGSHNSSELNAGGGDRIMDVNKDRLRVLGMVDAESFKGDGSRLTGINKLNSTTLIPSSDNSYQTWLTTEGSHSFDGAGFSVWGGEVGNVAFPLLKILKNGNVGIGKTKPTEKLDVDGNALISGNVGIGKSGPTEKLDVDGSVLISGGLKFGSQTRQMLNLYSTSYGIGVQSGTQYFRSGKNFAWYKGGDHNGSELNAGGGTLLMDINDSRLNVTGDVEADSFIGDGSQLTGVNISLPADYNFETTAGIDAGTAIVGAYDSLISGTVMTVGGAIHIGPESGGLTEFPVDASYQNALLWVEKGIVTEDMTYSFAGNWQEFSWPDYVFESNYVLQDLNTLEQYIKTNKHLPKIPSSQEVRENGVSDKEMMVKMLEKIEELTLYVIEQNKEIQILKKKNSN